MGTLIAFYLKHNGMLKKNPSLVLAAYTVGNVLDIVIIVSLAKMYGKI